MRKILLGIFLVGSLILTGAPCMAAEGNIFVGSAESDEIMTDMNIILQEVSDYGITQENMNLNNIIRVYISLNVPDEEIESADDMMTFLSNKTYVYCLPAYTGTAAYYLTIAQGNEISEEEFDEANIPEEERAYLTSLVGKWNVTEVRADEHSETPKVTDYLEKMNVFLNCYGLENSETFFFGALTSESLVTAICFTDENEPYYVALDNVDLDAQSVDDLDGAVYTYDEMKAFSVMDKSEEYNESNSGIIEEAEITGGYGTINIPDILITIVLPIIIVVATGVVIVVIIQIRKRKA